MSGLALFNVFILIFMVVAAVISLRVKDLLTASVVFGIYSLALAGVGQSVITAPPGSCSFKPIFLCQPVN